MKRTNLFVVVIISLFFLGCDAILEEDISDDVMIAISPSEADIILSNVVTFQWLELDGADDYRLQIIESGGFYILDSLINDSMFTFQIGSGAYSWRIRGENFAYNTEYSFPINFSVDISEDLSSQILILNTPTDGIYLNEVDNLLFTWQDLISATTYDLEFKKNLNGTQTILQDYDLSAVSYSPLPTLFDEDASYEWRVRGVNSTSQTVFSQRVIYVDRVIPNQPQLNLPDDNTVSTALNIDFSWGISADVGNIQSPISYTVDIANDIDFNTILVTYETSNISQSHVFSDIGVYYWRIQAIDQAGNMSTISQSRNLTIN